MDSFELNKIIGAVLGTCLILLVTNFTASALFTPVMPEKPGFAIAVKAEGAAAAKEAAPAKSEPIEQLLETRGRVGLAHERNPNGSVRRPRGRSRRGCR